MYDQGRRARLEFAEDMDIFGDYELVLVSLADMSDLTRSRLTIWLWILLGRSLLLRAIVRRIVPRGQALESAIWPGYPIRHARCRCWSLDLPREGFARTGRRSRWPSRPDSINGGLDLGRRRLLHRGGRARRLRHNCSHGGPDLTRSWCLGSSRAKGSTAKVLKAFGEDLGRDATLVSKRAS